MKFFLLSIPAFGHMNPELGVVKELLQQGHQVLVGNTKDFSERIHKIGAEFFPPPVDIPLIDFKKLKSASIMAQTSLSATKLVWPYIQSVIESQKPDCILHDSMALWGKLAGLKTKVPTISLITTMGINWRVVLGSSRLLLPDFVNLVKDTKNTMNIINEYRGYYRALSKPAPLITDLFCNEEELNIVFTSRYFQPYATSFRSHFKFVGPIIYDRPDESLDESLFETKQPLIYISLGTIYNDNLDIYRTLIQVFNDQPYRVFMAVSKQIPLEKLGPMSANITALNYIPQLQVLKKASLFVSHAGMNSVNESLYFGVPLLMLPQIQEQKFNATRVEQLGAGLFYREPEFSVQKLRANVSELLSNPRYQENAKKISETLVSAGGAKKAVSHILEYVQAKKSLLT